MGEKFKNKHMSILENHDADKLPHREIKKWVAADLEALNTLSELPKEEKQKLKKSGKAERKTYWLKLKDKLQKKEKVQVRLRR